MSDQATSGPVPWREWKARRGKWAEVFVIEWLSDQFVSRVRDWQFVKALELIGKFTLVFAAASWVIEAGERDKARADAAKAKHFRAWELISVSRGFASDGGRRAALEDLNRDRVSLRGAPLSLAFLEGVNLTNADLDRADLTGADLSDACLQHAKLKHAKLDGSTLTRSNLIGADLTHASLAGTQSPWVNLRNAILQKANLKGANLRNANLENAYLVQADLREANLTEANFKGAEGWSYDIVAGATLCRTRMPDGQLNSSSCPADSDDPDPAAPADRCSPK